MKRGKHYARSNYKARSRRRRSRVPFVCVAVAIFVIAAIVAITAVGIQSCEQEDGDVKKGQQIEVIIPEGSSTSDIAKSLAENGVIASSVKFSKRVEELGNSSKLKSGSYILTGGDNIDSIITTLVEGKTGRVLVIPEGFTLKQIAARVHETCGIDTDEFYKLTQQASRYAKTYPFLSGVYNDSMEGFLYPDTYRVETYETADDVIKMMLSQFQAKVQTVDMSYAESKNLNLYDVVTLASIVEKEFRDEKEKASLASVFYNRLHEGITLGSDVTTYYAVGKDMTEELTVEDLNSDSPYNTRNPEHYGLPAGPICNPSISTIEAAANPAREGYLYFFYSKKEDKTMFFETEEEFQSAWAEHGE